MDRKVRLLLLVVILCALTVSLAAADPPDTATNKPGSLRLDLATMPPGEVETRPGGRNATYNEIVIINAIPRFIPYDVDIAIEDVGLAPLSLDAFGPRGTGAPGTGVPSTAEDPCQSAIAGLVEKLDAVEAEKDVPGIGAAAKAAAPNGCKEKVWAEFTSRTRYTITETFSVRSDQTLNVTASRPGEASIVKFKVSLPGTPLGEWRTSYGFFFLPDRDDRYYVKETTAAAGTTPAKFTIFKQQHRQEFAFVPTVVFTFFPTGAGKKSGVHGWAAGLGYDLEKPFVFGGYSYAYNENVIFTGGLAFHRQSRLLGKYKGKIEGEVTQLLEPAQLVEDTYGPNVYVGISFRFGEDIHARRKALEDATANAQEAAAAAKAKAKAAEDESNLRKAVCIAQAEAAAAKAKEAKECRDDAVCIARVEKEEAAAKAECPLTELERVKAVKDEAAKAAALKNAEALAACKDTAKKANKVTLGDCTEALDACKKTAKGEAAGKECEAKAARCNDKANAALAAAEGQCLKQ